MFPWLKRSLLNLWRKPFRTLLVTFFLALVVGLFTVMATINRLATRQFAELEGALETTVDIRPIGSLGLGGRRSKPLPFKLEEEIYITKDGCKFISESQSELILIKT